MRPIAWIGLFAGIVSCGSAATGPQTDYVPRRPFTYDGRYLEGSFETLQGFGWDTCYTRTAGLFPQRGTENAPEGDQFLILESGGCSGSCAPTNPSSSQLYLWFDQLPTDTEAMGLYFDIEALAVGPPIGTLLLYGTDSNCQGDTEMASAPLGRLEISSSWSTRCVTVTGPGAYDAIGVAVTGGPYKLGLDALRLGPPCQ